MDIRVKLYFKDGQSDCIIWFVDYSLFSIIMLNKFFFQFFSALSCFVLAVFDQDLSATTRYENPKLYFKGERFGYKV